MEGMSVEARIRLVHIGGVSTAHPDFYRCLLHDPKFIEVYNQFSIYIHDCAMPVLFYPPASWEQWAGSCSKAQAGRQVRILSLRGSGMVDTYGPSGTVL